MATALRAGRLTPPLTELALQPYVGRAAAAVAPTLLSLTDDGLATQHLAVFLDLLATQRDGLSPVDRIVELVSTGPEAPGTPSRDTRIVVRELFLRAERSVLVAGYAVYQGRDVFQSLAERMEAIPGLRVQMFLDVQRSHGDTSSSTEILRRFAERFRQREWPGTRRPEVYYDPRSLEMDGPKRASLHAKCVVIDGRVAFVSSANFTKAAQVRNIEVGVLVRSAPFARQLEQHFATLADRDDLRRVPAI